MLPPRRRTPEAVSMLAGEERGRNREERKQQSNWAHGRPTHGSETSPNRAHNKTQGNYEVRALQQPPNAAHAERAISKHLPPSSTRCPRTPQGWGLRNGGGGRACAWEAATTKGMAWPASPVATGCQGNPCSTGIRWGVSPAAQMGYLRNRSGSPSGADQP